MLSPRAFIAFALFPLASPLAAQDGDLPRLPNPVIVAERLAGQLVRLDPGSGELVDHALDPEIAIGHFVLYYGAGWSPTCEKFTPALAKFYEEKKAAGANFEVVFVSFDDSEAEMAAFMKATKMPWPAVRFGSVKVGTRSLTEGEDDNGEAEPAPEPLRFIEQAAGRGVPCLAVMDSRGLIVAHSYKRRKEYLGAEKTLEEFAALLASAEEKRAAQEGDGE